MFGISCWWITRPLSRSESLRQSEVMVSWTLAESRDTETRSPNIPEIPDPSPPRLLPAPAPALASHTRLMHSLAMADLETR